MSNEIDSLGGLQTQLAQSGVLYYINNESWHRGSPATKNGWRFFIRASINHGRKIENQQRYQVQVYLNDMNTSW